MRIGVLAIQGSFAEHRHMLDEIGVESFEIRQKKDLDNGLDGLILPGGESTTIGKLLHDLDLFDPLKTEILNGMPVFGTCAGLILLAKEVVDNPVHFGVLDMKVLRNAYGRQIDSFHSDARIPEVSDKPVPLVFIRAPWIESVGENVQILLNLDGHITAVRERNMLASSFHPELTGDTSFHRYFLDMVHEYIRTR